MGVRTPTRGAPDRAHGGRGRRGPLEVRVSLLDGFAVTVDGNPIRMGAAERRLVAAAALRPRPLRRPEVAALLWPHLTDASAAASVRTSLSRVRSACPQLLSPDPRAVRVAEHVRVDAWELEQIASRLIAGRDGVPEGFSRDVLSAELLPELREDWIIFERDRLRDLCMHAIESLATRLCAEGHFAEALVTVCDVLRVDPLRESAERTRVEIHLAEGNRALAVRCYLDFRARSLRELGMEPSEEFQALVRPLLGRG